jgi:hypothetical protein
MAIKHKICNNDPASGKKLVAYVQAVPFGPAGNPYHVEIVVHAKENDEETEATPPGTTERDKQRVQPWTELFTISSGRRIDPITKLWDYDGSNQSAVELDAYFRDKLINTLPGVGGNDPLSKMCEGILREVINIKQANGEWPNN